MVRALRMLRWPCKHGGWGHCHELFKECEFHLQKGVPNTYSLSLSLTHTISLISLDHTVKKGWLFTNAQLFMIRTCYRTLSKKTTLKLNFQKSCNSINVPNKHNYIICSFLSNKHCGNPNLAWWVTILYWSQMCLKFVCQFCNLL